jgi:hypothetical protein
MDGGFPFEGHGCFRNLLGGAGGCFSMNPFCALPQRAKKPT